MTVKIPSSIIEIEDYAFCSCSNLKEILYEGTISQWNTITIGKNNESLKTAIIHYKLCPDLVLPSSLTAIESEAFTGGAFTYVLVPAGVTEIGSGAFAGCPNLHYAEICGTKTEIDPAAFDGVTGLTIIAPSGSKAETWATEHYVNFQPAA